VSTYIGQPRRRTGRASYRWALVEP
jgi:hypothetical protein